MAKVYDKCANCTGSEGMPAKHAWCRACRRAYWEAHKEKYNATRRVPPSGDADLRARHSLKAWEYLEAARASKKRDPLLSIQIGRHLVAARAACAHGEWGEELKYFGLSRSTAHYYIAAFKRHRIAEAGEPK